MTGSSRDGIWRDPKWLVVAVAIAVFAMIANFDWRLGLAAGALLGFAGALWIYLAVRYGGLSGTPSGRAALAMRVRQHEDNRRAAMADALSRSRAQQGADPGEGA